MYIANMPIQKVNALQINECLLELTSKYANSSISKVRMRLAKIYNKSYLNGIIKEVPFTIKNYLIQPKSKKKDKIIEAFTVEEQQKFMQQLKLKNYKYKDVFYTLIETGMRVGEVLALRRTDVDFKNNIIHVKRSLTKDKNDRVKIGTNTKTYNGIRDVPLSKQLKEILLANMNIDLFFTLPDGKLITPSTINSHFKRICKDAGIRPCIYELHRKGKIIKLKSSNVNTHLLRKCYASRSIESGMSAVVLQRILRPLKYKNYARYIYISIQPFQNK